MEQFSVFNVAGRTTIDDLAHIIYLCGLFISTDSGPYHLSVALNRKTIGLFMWNNRTCFHNTKGVKNIVLDGSQLSSERVFSAAMDLLA